MSSFEDWNADMDAWGLVGSQRVHHLWRLHAYHCRIADRRQRGIDHTDIVHALFALAMVLIALVSLMVAS